MTESVHCTAEINIVLGWLEKVHSGFFCNILGKNSNKLFDQPNKSTILQQK